MAFPQTNWLVGVINHQYSERRTAWPIYVFIQLRAQTAGCISATRPLSKFYAPDVHVKVRAAAAATRRRFARSTVNKSIWAATFRLLPTCGCVCSVYKHRLAMLRHPFECSHQHFKKMRSFPLILVVAVLIAINVADSKKSAEDKLCKDRKGPNGRSDCPQSQYLCKNSLYKS